MSEQVTAHINTSQIAMEQNSDMIAEVASSGKKATIGNLNNLVADLARQLKRLSRNNLVRSYIAMYAQHVLLQEKYDKLLESSEKSVESSEKSKNDLNIKSSLNEVLP